MQATEIFQLQTTQTPFKTRPYTMKDRLYFEAMWLLKMGFTYKTAVKYVINIEKKCAVITPAEESNHHVSYTTQNPRLKGKGLTEEEIQELKKEKGKKVPVIDIKGKDDINEFFQFYKDCEIQVQVYKGLILLTVKEPEVNESREVSLAEELQAEPNVIPFEAKKGKQTPVASAAKQHQYAISVRDLAKVSGYEQMSIFDFFSVDTKEPKGRKGSNGGKGIATQLKEKAIKMLSLFSGCGSMDKGFVDEGGYDIVFANDRFDKRTMKTSHIDTYKANIGNHIVMRDIMEFTEGDIPEVDFVAAGIPCVTFSALNTTESNFRNSTSHSHPVVEQTLNIIKWSKAKAFLFENVERFLTVKGGAVLKRIKERLPGWKICSKIIDATCLGSAQKRKRAFVFGMLEGEPSLELPIVSEVRTVRDAFEGVESAPQQDLFFTLTPLMEERMSHVPPGGNILDVPEHLRAPNKKFTNYCQRLHLDQQANTVTHVQDDAICPHDKTLKRYITVREAARLFSLPDDFLFSGSRTAIFEMLKNAVDYRVSRFLAKTIKSQLLPVLV